MQENRTLENELEFLNKKILELNTKLIESEKSKSKFLSLISNELNNPMTVLLSMVPHLQTEVCDKNRKIISMVNQEILELDFKIKNLIMVTEIESGNINITHALVDAKEIIDEVIESLKYLMDEKKIQIKLTNFIEEKLVSDPQKIYTIASNLLSNSCKYSLENSVVDVILKKENAIFTIIVKNEGKAPDIRFKAELFTRFSDTPSGDHGLGIGLSVVREICESLDGSIEYMTEDGFVTFTASLSVDDETMMSSQAYGSNEFLFESIDDVIEL